MQQSTSISAAQFASKTDILYNIVEKRLRGQRGIVESYHIPELLEGNVTGGIWTYYTDVNQLLHNNFDQAIHYIIEGTRRVTRCSSGNRQRGFGLIIKSM